MVHKTDMTAAELVTVSGLRGEDIHVQAASMLDMADGLVDAYTRGRHRTRAGMYRRGIQAVITSVASRMLANPSQIAEREQIANYSFYREAGFKGFTITELMVLDRYRKRGI